MRKETATQDAITFAPGSVMACESARSEHGYVLIGMTADNAAHTVVARDIESEADAYYLKRAVNCHDELVALLRRVLANRPSSVKDTAPRGLMGEIAAALAKAEA